MSQSPKIKYRLGEQVAYSPNKNLDPVLLTYVEVLKNGLGRFFSSEFPSLEYHIPVDSEKLKTEEIHFEGVQEKYHAFKGGDDKKRQAYEILLTRR